MTLIQASRADSWADGAYLEARCVAPPVDLHAIARLRKIARIKLRLMVEEGALVPVPGGFEVYVQNLKSSDLSVESAELPDALNARQRFTLAHEIVHTLFYESPGETPVPTRKIRSKYEDPDRVGLEEICDRAAARLLVPKPLLKREIRESLDGDCERIDAPFVRLMTQRFRVSYEVMIGRFRAVEPQNAFARSIMLVRKSEQGHQLVTSYTGATLLSAFPRLGDYEHRPIRDLLPELPTALLGSVWNMQCEARVRGRTLLLRRFQLGGKGSFLLQVDDLDHRAPESVQD